jgi:hypothetical protein
LVSRACYSELLRILLLGTSVNKGVIQKPSGNVE